MDTSSSDFQESTMVKICAKKKPQSHQHMKITQKDDLTLKVQDGKVIDEEKKIDSTTNESKSVKFADTGFYMASIGNVCDNASAAAAVGYQCDPVVKQDVDDIGYESSVSVSCSSLGSNEDSRTHLMHCSAKRNGPKELKREKDLSCTGPKGIFETQSKYAQNMMRVHAEQGSGYDMIAPSYEYGNNMDKIGGDDNREIYTERNDTNGKSSGKGQKRSWDSNNQDLEEIVSNDKVAKTECDNELEQPPKKRRKKSEIHFDQSKRNEKTKTKTHRSKRKAEKAMKDTEIENPNPNIYYQQKHNWEEEGNDLEAMKFVEKGYRMRCLHHSITTGNRASFMTRQQRRINNQKQRMLARQMKTVQEDGKKINIVE